MKPAARRPMPGARFLAMLWKEFIQMRRDRMTLGMMIGIPAMQIILFGYAIRMEVRNLPMVVLDEARTVESRSLATTLENTGNFRIIGHVTDRGELKEAIERGIAHAALVIPPDFTRDLKRGRGAMAQVIVDAADPLSSTAAINGAALVGATLSGSVQAGVRPRAEVRVRPWYNPDLKSSTFIVPGIIGVLLSMTLVLVTSMAIVRERERGTLEQLIVTPIDKTSLMLGKLVPFILVGYVQMTIILLLGRLLFDVPILGSLPLLYAITMGYIVANLALGMFVSTVATTQAQAMQLSFMLMLPNILLSGFMFPREAMPVPAQWLSAVLPLTYYLDVLRGILLKGIGFDILWRQTALLAGFAVLLIAFSVSRFRKTIG
jgi:ABC-2 type transport system permease protein